MPWRADDFFLTTKGNRPLTHTQRAKSSFLFDQSQVKALTAIANLHSQVFTLLTQDDVHLCRRRKTAPVG